MRKLLVLAALGAIASGLVPAQAAEPYCAFYGANLGDDGTRGMACTFEADDLPHGYLALTPNNFRIFLDVNGNGQFNGADGDTVVAEVSPSAPEPIVGALDLESGKSYTVEVFNGCAGVCGHIGMLIVK